MASLERTAVGERKYQTERWDLRESTGREDNIGPAGWASSGAEAWRLSSSYSTRDFFDDYGSLRFTLSGARHSLVGTGSLATILLSPGCAIVIKVADARATLPRLKTGPTAFTPCTCYAIRTPFPLFLMSSSDEEYPLLAYGGGGANVIVLLIPLFRRLAT